MSYSFSLLMFIHAGCCLRPGYEGYCRLTQFPAETGLNASVAKNGEFMRQCLKQGPSLFRGFFVWKPGGYPFHNLSYFVGDHCTGKSSDMWQKELFDSLHRRFDAYHRLNLAICRSARTKIQPFSATSKKGEFISRSVFRAKLCAGKRGFDSSIQAQGTGEVMVILTATIGTAATPPPGTQVKKPLPKSVTRCKPSVEAGLQAFLSLL